MTVAELLPGPEPLEVPDPDADDVERGFVAGVMVAEFISFVGLSLRVLTRTPEELLLFSTSSTRSFSSFSSAFLRLCAIRPA